MDSTYHTNPFNSRPESSTRQFLQASFMNRTYGWMFCGMLLTALVCLGVASSERAIRFIFEHSWMFFAVMIAELAIVIGLSTAQKKLSESGALLAFFVYSMLNGVTFSVIFLAFQPGSIAWIFLLAAGMFGGLALFGSITKRNLSAVGTFMALGLIGIIILSLVNMFFKSESLNFGLALASVVVFSGLTAYDTQRIRAMALEYGEADSIDRRKEAIFGALTLYLDFINLFLSLLRIFGRRRE